jgi:hypothetical protein
MSMSGSKPPMEGSKDPFEAFRSEQIQREKHAREEYRKDEGRREHALVVHILKIFKSFVELFQDRDKQAALPVQKKSLFLRFKAALERLKHDDLSGDPSYLDELSFCWQQLLENAYLLPKGSAFAEGMRFLVREIQVIRPSGEEHTLGYYLSEHAGKKWFPAPVRELIHDLHVEHQNKGFTSILSRWTQELDRMIALFST